MVAPGGGVHGCSWGGMHGCLGGHAWLLLGGHAWLLPGGCVWLLGGVHGCSWGEGGMQGCVVAPRRWGACMVAWGCVAAPGGDMRGCSRGGAWLLQRGCVVAPRGGMHGCSGGMRGIRRDTEIRSMSGRYASYWNAFLFTIMIILRLHNINVTVLPFRSTQGSKAPWFCSQRIRVSTVVMVSKMVFVDINVSVASNSFVSVWIL